LAENIRKNLKEWFDTSVFTIVKRGCSEYSKAYPKYNQRDENGIFAMSYPVEWKQVEDLFDKTNQKKGMEEYFPSYSSFCLSDLLVVQKWIDYAKGIGDPSVQVFKNRPIIYQATYDVAKARVKKAGVIFNAL
jgi:hypothetical protein